MRAKLTDDEIATELAALPGWTRAGDALTRAFAFPAFMDGIAFVNRVAHAAEEANHHPDVHIHWNTVKLRWWTHVRNAITERDVEMAVRSSELA